MLGLSATKFEKEIAGKDIIVLFYADYCPYCRQFKEIFESKEEELQKYEKYRGLVFAESNITDDNNPLWERCTIEVVPTIIRFKNSRTIKRKDGVLGKGLTEKDLEMMVR